MQNRILSSESSRKTETLCCRIDSNLRSGLEAESKKLGISLNALVSHVFTRYLTWGRYAERLKLIPISKDLLRELFDSVTREETAGMAKRIAETSGREHVLFLFQQISPGTVLKFVDIWSSHFDAYEHSYDGKTHFYTVRHDVNLNFSHFVRDYLSSMIQGTIPRNVRFETVSPNQVTFSLEA